MPKRTTSDALEILAQMTGKDPAMQRMLEEELAKTEIAVKIYWLRKQAGLTQGELAKRVGTTQSVISRLEDADYQGHSLAMLSRIASAMDRKVEIRFVPRKRRGRLKGERWLRRARGSATTKITSDEIMCATRDKD